jgi:hypothetical protein
VHEGILLGFAEQFGRGTPGLLRLTETHLEFRGSRGEVAEAHWPLEAITALQSSSSSVQVTLKGGELLQFRFDGSIVDLIDLDDLLDGSVNGLFKNFRNYVHHWAP